MLRFRDQRKKILLLDHKKAYRRILISLKIQDEGLSSEVQNLPNHIWARHLDPVFLS